MYQAYDIASMSDVPAIVQAFAANVGWTVDNTDPTHPRLKSPHDESATNFRLFAEFLDSNRDHWFRIDAPDSGSPVSAGCRSPKLSGTDAAPNVSLPTKIHMFGSLLPIPWIAGVIEYGFNSYRHFYIGNMMKYGSYVGGEIISGSVFWNTNSSYQDRGPAYYDQSHLYLFRGLTTWNSATDVLAIGGVHVDHPDNPNPWRRFNFRSRLDTSTDEQAVGGGFLDAVNDGYVGRAHSSYAGGTILVPVNLYAPRASGYAAPIGHPPGVRMVDMRDIEPGASVEVGNEVWRCFPQFRKSTNEGGTPELPGGWTIEESSFNLGYAFQES